MFHLFTITIAIFLYLSVPFSAFADEWKNQVDAESGLLWQAKNAFQIPNDSRGTRLDLSDIEKGPFFVNRFSFTRTIGGPHKLRLLVAPLSLKFSHVLQNDLLFQEKLFERSELLSIDYKFNSYRLSYLYTIKHNENWSWHIGATLKVRDAKIAVRGRGISVAKKNIGLVPLVKFGLVFTPSSSKRFTLELDGDALAAPQGRAEDLAIKVNYWTLHQQGALYLGYRVLEGGADNKDVYTFSLFHYLIAGLKLDF
ncbi:MAG: hypothetical protein HQK50_19415 [Oligoflexia bacterium]|nr:hypothetical protein [Oligoflexia bacterium]MBF0367745.1 hypothetical protein [Oligoflexia bacterium]